MQQLPKDVGLAFIKGMSAGHKNECRPCSEECPECGGDMVYTEPKVIHRDPDRKRVKCKGCDYRGFLLV